MTLAIDIMDEWGLSNKACRERLPKERYISRSFCSSYAAASVAKLGTRQSASVYRGEWTYHMRSEAFKELELQSKIFSLNNFVKCTSKIVLFVRY